jgi:hypothetical protein
MSEKYEVMVEDGHLVITDEVADLLKRARMLDTTIKELTDKRDSIIKTMKDAMNKNGIDKFESPMVNISRTAYSMKEEVNVDKLKKDGLYDQYVYHVPSGGSLRVSYPKEKKNG